MSSKQLVIMQYEVEHDMKIVAKRLSKLKPFLFSSIFIENLTIENYAYNQEIRKV